MAIPDNITSIILDYDGVFIPDEYRGMRSICPDERLLYQIEKSYYTKSDCSSYWQEIQNDFHLDIATNELEQKYNFEDNEQLVHEQQIVNLFAPLSTTCNLFLLSNQITDRTNYIRKKPYLSFFKKMYFSNEIGYAKPDRRIFEYVFHDQKVKSEECLFVDDSDENVNAAHALGIKAMHFTSIEELAKRLKKI